MFGGKLYRRREDMRLLLLGAMTAIVRDTLLGQQYLRKGSVR